jgi:hypothetical protein
LYFTPSGQSSLAKVTAKDGGMIVTHKHPMLLAWHQLPHGRPRSESLVLAKGNDGARRQSKRNAVMHASQSGVQRPGRDVNGQFEIEVVAHGRELY